MAEEQLELRKSLAKAKEEERIFEQMNNEELVSTPTCLQKQRLSIFPVSSLLTANVTKDTNIASLSTLGSAVTMTMATIVHAHQMPFQCWNLLQSLSQHILLTIMS